MIEQGEPVENLEEIANFNRAMFKLENKIKQKKFMDRSGVEHVLINNNKHNRSNFNNENIENKILSHKLKNRLILDNIEKLALNNKSMLDLQSHKELQKFKNNNQQFINDVKDKIKDFSKNDLVNNHFHKKYGTKSGDFTHDYIQNKVYNNETGLLQLVKNDQDYILKENPHVPVYIRNKIISTSEIYDLLKEIKDQERHKYDNQIKRLRSEMDILKNQMKIMNTKDNSNQNFIKFPKPIVNLKVNNIYDNKQLDRISNYENLEKSINIFSEFQDNLTKKIEKKDELNNDGSDNFEVVFNKGFINENYKNFIKNENYFSDLELQDKYKMKKDLKRKFYLESRNKWQLVRYFFYTYVNYNTIKRLSEVRKVREELNEKNLAIYKEDLYVITRYTVRLFLSVFNNIKLLREYDLKKGFARRSHQSTIKDQNKIILQMMKVFFNQVVTADFDWEGMNDRIKLGMVRYIRDRTFFVEEFLFEYEINRINFNLFGVNKPISIEVQGMLVAFLFVSKSYVYNFLFQPLRFSHGSMMQFGFMNVSSFLGSLIHRMICESFLPITKRVYDYYSFLNYYRTRNTRHLEVERFQGHLEGDTKFELSDIEAHVNFYSREDTDTFVDSNRLFWDDATKKISIYFISWAKKLRNEFGSVD